MVYKAGATGLKRMAWMTLLMLLVLAAALPALAQDGAIEFGQSIDAELTTSAPIAEYTFTGTAGDSIIAGLHSDDFDSYLTLEFDGDEIAYNDDGGENFDSLIGPFSLPETGEYTLIATSLNRSSPGEYELNLSKVDLVMLSPGETSTVDVTEDNTVLFFQFEGTSGQVIDIEVDSDDDIDTDAVLNGPDGFEMTSDTDSGSGDNPEINNQPLRSNGVYTLVLTIQDAAAGSLEVTVDVSELPSLNEGSQSLSFSTDTYEQSVTFEGTEGSTYRVTITTTEGTSNSLSLELNQEGSVIGNVNTGSLSRLSFDFTTPADGTVVIRVTEYAYEDVTHEVTLEEVAE